MERRNFIKNACQLCLLGGLAGWTAALESCAAPNSIYKTNIQNRTIEVPLSLMQGKKIQIIRPAEIDFDIAVRPEQNGSYKALLLACTHHENPLNVTGNGFICMLHGSQFDLEGEVRRGPASFPLKEYKTEIKNNKLLIHIS